MASYWIGVATLTGIYLIATLQHWVFPSWLGSRDCFRLDMQALWPLELM